MVKSTIADPLYGSVQITEVENEIISTSTYQRLHNVKQLGQANLIFPGANYSRFSHSIGALRNAGKLIQALIRNSETESEKDKLREVMPKYRLAALLHDVGHFPFSHATESALKELNKDIMTKDSSPSYDLVMDHEEFGELIITRNPQILDVLDEHGFDPKEVASVFASNNTGDSGEVNLKPIISSELDCDRLDYLRRTSHFSGLPFGNVDIDYLISSVQMVGGRLCFNGKSKRSVDHMLLARFHDYLQVVFHKKLIALEWSLKECIKICAGVDVDSLNVSKQRLLERIGDGTIRNFDDNEVINVIKRNETALCKIEGPIKYHVSAVLYRKNAELVFMHQSYLGCDELSKHNTGLEAVTKVVEEFATGKGVSLENFLIWDKRHYISKVKPEELCRTPLEDIYNAEELVYINGGGFFDEPAPLINYPDSIVGTLSTKILSDIRVFILPVEGSKELSADLLSRLNSSLESTLVTQIVRSS
jgi:HD superfamily phosphohydrolase